ncbi:MAG: hypothetical protein ACYTG7_12440, partial [Planctomycetota bacterium]
QWREAVQWFEKAREGAGGRYPDAIETNIRFCRISLEKEIKSLRSAADDAFSNRRYAGCLEKCDAWLALDSGSGDALQFKRRATRAQARKLLDEGAYSEGRAFLHAALDDFEEDEVLQSLTVRLEQEDMPAEARIAWERAAEAEKEENWIEVVAALEEGLNVPLEKGFNAHYRALAEAKMEGARARAYEQMRLEAHAAMEGGDYEKAHELVDRTLEYRPGFPPLLTLKAQIEEKAFEAEEHLILSARVGEKAAGVQNISQARSEQDFMALRNAASGYEEYLAAYPEGEWSAEANAALGSLKKKRGKYPHVAGFTLKKTETFTCGGVSKTVAIYDHEKTGLEFVLVPGNRFLMGAPPLRRSKKAGVKAKGRSAP